MRVLDFGRYIAGPYCATMLAEFGAEVIGVEKRDGSEDRFVVPVGEAGEGRHLDQHTRWSMGKAGPANQLSRAGSAFAPVDISGRRC